MDLPDSWTDRRSAIVRQNAAESVFEDLRSAIESGELPVGVKLPPKAALAERYGVSRSVIREAPGEDGVGHHRCLVARVRPELREVLVVDAQFNDLTRPVEQMDGETDPARRVRLDTQFHLGIAQASGNAVFTTIGAAIRGALSVLSRKVVSLGCKSSTRQLMRRGSVR